MRGSLPGLVGSVLTLALVFGLLSGCAGEKTKVGKKEPIPVVVQLSSVTKKEQLERRVNEMLKRGFYVTVQPTLDVVGCDYIKNLSDKGFEIMLRYPFQEMKGTYQEQLDYALREKQLMENCIGKKVRGFYGGTRFNRGNQYTDDIMDEIGAKYYLAYANYEKLPCYALEPYKVPGHKFIRLPMQIRCVFNVGAHELDPKTLAVDGAN